ncbi:MAG TPA: hypothetical protein VES42_27405 [Pilimelia sp.]|nr:hypothetical protein [Pilimelia sp.]
MRDTIRRYGRGTGAAALASGVAVAVLAGCAGRAVDGGQPAPAPTGTPVVHPRWTSCDAALGPATGNPKEQLLGGGADGAALPRLDDSLRPVAAVVCHRVAQRRPGGGEDLVAREDRAGDVAALVAALRLPDEPRTADACALDLPRVAWFALLDEDGRWVRPGLPADACGKVRIEVRDAVAALDLRPVRSTAVGEIESSAAAAAGCSMQWADMVWVETREPGAGRAGRLGTALSPAGQLRWCVYRVPAAERGSGKPAGEFERGGVLAPPRRAAIERALAAAPPARLCTSQASRFGLLRPVDGTSGEVYVELDGCRRVMAVPPAGGVVLAQGDAALAALLAAT